MSYVGSRKHQTLLFGGVNPRGRVREAGKAGLHAGRREARRRRTRSPGAGRGGRRRQRHPVRVDAQSGPGPSRDSTATTNHRPSQHHVAQDRLPRRRQDGPGPRQRLPRQGLDTRRGHDRERRPAGQAVLRGVQGNGRHRDLGQHAGRQAVQRGVLVGQARHGEHSAEAGQARRVQGQPLHLHLHGHHPRRPGGRPAPRHARGARHAQHARARGLRGVRVHLRQRGAARRRGDGGAAAGRRRHRAPGAGEARRPRHRAQRLRTGLRVPGDRGNGRRRRQGGHAPRPGVPAGGADRARRGPPRHGHGPAPGQAARRRHLARRLDGGGPLPPGEVRRALRLGRRRGGRHEALQGDAD